jgi:hypothetical protein
MAKIHHFRRLRHGQTPKLSTPDFLRAEQARDRRQSRLGVVVVVALIAAAVVLLSVWR